MNCTFHFQNQISLICRAPHKCECQRKLCAECQDIHGVDPKYIVSVKKFREMVNKKLTEVKFGESSSELTKWRGAFKSLLSQTESMFQKIWEGLSQSIKQVYDLIEKENQLFYNLINENTNLAESSYADIEKLVKIVEGTTLDEWNDSKNSYMMKLDETKKWWDHHIHASIEKLKEGIELLKSLIKEVEEDIYFTKTDLFEMLTYLQDIDETLYKKILEILRREKVSDIFGFIQMAKNQNLKYKGGKENHKFNQNDYSSEIYEKTRSELIKKKVNKGIIDFIKFLVLITSIDGKFIQSGSNGLSLLVDMKVDLKNQCFENIRIKNASLIGGNFVRCNLSGSEFDNVDISGVNLNGAQMFNCQWKNIKINELNKLDGHSSCVNSVCISPDGNTLASGSDDQSIRLWDTKTGLQKAKLDGHTNLVMSVCFSPDGNTLASGSYDKSIRLWDVTTGQQQAKLEGHTHNVNSTCFSPDGNTLASCSWDTSVRLWDVKTRQQIDQFDGHTRTVYSVCFSPDGNTLASSSFDNSIRLWDVRTGQQQKAQLDGHNDYFKSICFSPDGNTLASCSVANSICLWDIKKGQQKAQLDGHSDVVKQVCFSPDGNTLASGSWDNSIRLWNVKTGLQKAKLDGHTSGILSVCFSPDGNTLASGSYDNSIRLWDVIKGQQKAKQDSHSDYIPSVYFSPDGNTLASCNYDKSIRLWDVKTGQQKAKLDGHSNYVMSVCFSPDGKTLASGSIDKTIRLWDVKTGQQIGKLDGHSDYVISVCFTPDGNTLASGSIENSIRLWNLKKGQEIKYSDKNYKDLLKQFKIPLQQNSPLSFPTSTTTLLISQQAIFQAKEALILKGDFINQEGQNLRQLFKSSGSCFLEDLKQQSI
ncbi:unnamed protein product [Paramecium pentaurelia]|uniref:EML-like second beta-propeller domain-containing protein n=1 Tax=Paramecium pentaurelia TaxID=43138 RepID=A0A8S1WVD6_9CILI|nr:unnamed protein product [Paramecium pentaurelia]